MRGPLPKTWAPAPAAARRSPGMLTRSQVRLMRAWRQLPDLTAGRTQPRPLGLTASRARPRPPRLTASRPRRRPSRASPRPPPGP